MGLEQGNYFTSHIYELLEFISSQVYVMTTQLKLLKTNKRCVGGVDIEWTACQFTESKEKLTN